MEYFNFLWSLDDEESYCLYLTLLVSSFLFLVLEIFRRNRKDKPDCETNIIDDCNEDEEEIDLHKVNDQSEINKNKLFEVKNKIKDELTKYLNDQNKEIKIILNQFVKDHRDFLKSSQKISSSKTDDLMENISEIFENLDKWQLSVSKCIGDLREFKDNKDNKSKILSKIDEIFRDTKYEIEDQ